MKKIICACVCVSDQRSKKRVFEKFHFSDIPRGSPRGKKNISCKKDIGSSGREWRSAVDVVFESILTENEGIFPKKHFQCFLQCKW